MRAPETARFIQTLQGEPKRVVTAVADVLSQPGTIPKDESRVVFETMGWSIKHRNVPKVIPPWMSRIGIYSLASEITASPVWNTLLSGEPADTQERVAKELKFSPSDEQLAINNARFVTSAIVLGLLAAATGKTISECIQQDMKSPINLTFALQIGSKYENPPEDIEEYMKRVSELIPNPDIATLDNESTLLDYFTRYDAFKSPRTSGRCPATYFTRLLLEQWGRQLHEDQAYNDRFKKTILKES